MVQLMVGLDTGLWHWLFNVNKLLGALFYTHARIIHVRMQELYTMQEVNKPI